MRSSQRWPQTTASFASPNIHAWLYVYNFCSPRSHYYFIKFAVSTLSESFQLNAFTLDYWELKIKVLYTNVDTCGTTQATRRNSNSFLIVLLSMSFKKYYYITRSTSCVTLLVWYLQMIWPVAPNLGFCTRSGFSMPLWVFLLKVSGF